MIMLQPVPASSVKEIERPANDSGVSYVIMGPVVYFIHPATNHLMTSIFVGIFLYSVMTLPISFFYRYIAVCRPHWVQAFFKKYVLFCVFIFLVLISLLASFCMYAGDMPKSGPAAEVASWSEYYSHKGDSNETRFGNLIHMNFMVFYMCYIALIAIIAGYSLLIFSAMKIFHVLKKHQSTLSRRTLELQKALAMSLIVQVSLMI
uniref:Uncharacterized protein n=1 Tax=Panagrolaimus sp. ES5 TaxID=591445 RepID=A0AC34FW34_9BILA